MFKQPIEDLYTVNLDTAYNESADVQQMGAKGFNLARMAHAGLPVPPAFILGTETCRLYWQDKARAIDMIQRQIERGLNALEEKTGLILGDHHKPLLVSVRSGAPVSMPGMMETLLNVGLSEATASGLLRVSGNPRLVWDSCRRLIECYGEVVDGIPAHLFAESQAPRKPVNEMDFAELRELTRAYAESYPSWCSRRFPTDINKQLEQAVIAVFESWHTRRAKQYRKLHGIDENLGTAVIVQQMVFGNAGIHSGSGVAFTRNPATGTKGLYLDYVDNAQGEDVVSGRCEVKSSEQLAQRKPTLLNELHDVASRLETLFQDVQEFEFTVQQNILYLLQTRTAKRTDLAALRTTVNLVREGIIDSQTALARLQGLTMETIREQEIEMSASAALIAEGIPTGGGIASGHVTFTSEEAIKLHQRGIPAVLIRPDVATDDVDGMHHAVATVTHLGGKTSHAAVVARQMNKPCIVGCKDLLVDVAGANAHFSKTLIKQGTTVTVDGNTGKVYLGTLNIKETIPEDLLADVNAWRTSSADETYSDAV